MIGEMKIDLNCDMGEAFDESDESIMPCITSANIACGMHAGNPSIMQKTVRLAKQYDVAVGAHPGWPDLQGFGRRDMSFSSQEVEALVLYQVGVLAAIAKAEGVDMHHVKPHGALYNQAAKDRTLADAVVRAVKGFSRDLILVGLAGSALVEAGVDIGLRVAHEGFPDRNYNLDGTLRSRQQVNALIESSHEIAEHAVLLVRDGINFNGHLIHLDTLCLHGDHPHAARNARLVRDQLKKAGIQVLRL
jgi:5-oxoprolinase (ATP-hydrolysing) subunit A